MKISGYALLDIEKAYDGISFDANQLEGPRRRIFFTHVLVCISDSYWFMINL